MEEHATLRITAELKSLAQIRQFVLQTGQKLEADPELLLDVVHAVDEAATNILEHGYQKQMGPIEITIGREGRSMLVRILDQAALFDPTGATPPDLTLPLHRRPIGGLGIYLIREFVDEINYDNRQGVNELTLVKKAILPSISAEGNNEHKG